MEFLGRNGYACAVYTHAEALGEGLFVSVFCVVDRGL